MGLFSGLGKIVGGIFGGPIGGAIGGLVGGGIDDNKANKQQAAQNQANYNNSEAYFTDLRRRAKAGGFNPLDALRAGGGGGYNSAAPRLVSTTAGISKGFDMLDQVLTGQRAEEEKRKEVQDDLKKVETEQRLTTPAAYGSEQEEDEQSPYHDEDGNMYPYWGGPEIDIMGPFGPLKFPKRIAAQIGLEPGMALLPEMLEKIAGDEISQAMFADWLVQNGINVRGPNQGGSKKGNRKSIADMIRAAKDWLRGSVNPQATPSQTPKQVKPRVVPRPQRPNETRPTSPPSTHKRDPNWRNK